MKDDNYIMIEDLYDLISQNNEDGFIRLDVLCDDLKRYNTEYMLLGGKFVSRKHYINQTDLTRRLKALRAVMFDESKRYYNLPKVIERLFDQWNKWECKRLSMCVTKSFLCEILDVNRPTLDSYIDEMAKGGMKPYYDNNSYIKNEHKNISVVSIMAFLIKKCEMQNGEESVRQFYQKISTLQFDLID